MGAFDTKGKQPMFLTGKQLQQKRIQELTQTNIEQAMAGGRTAREKGNLGIGGALGSIFGALAEGDPQVAAGDILKSMDKMPETAEEFAALQKKMFQAGLTEDGLALTPKIKQLQEIQKSFGEADKGTKYTLTGDDFKNIDAQIYSRAGNDESIIGSTLVPMMDKEAPPGQQGQAATFKFALAEQVAAIHAKLVDKGFDKPKALIAQDLMDKLETTKDIVNPETGFLFWKQDGSVNTKLLNSSLESLGNSYVKHIEGLYKEDKPVKPAQATPSTSSQDTGNVEDVKGSVAGAGMPVDKGTKMINPDERKAAMGQLSKDLAQVNSKLAGIPSNTLTRNLEKAKLDDQRKAIIEKIKQLKASP